MNMQKYLALATLAIAPLGAQAGVIYEWRATNAQTPQNFTLQLEFDHRTVKRGSFMLDIESESGPMLAPRTGLLSLKYSFPGLSNDMFYTSKGREGFNLGSRGYLNMHVSFDEAGYLTGQIYANDTNSHIELGSVGTLFSVIDANSDEGMPGAGCGWQMDPPMQCGGATGYIQRVGEVPEPATGALIGLALVGGIYARRKKRSDR